MRCLGVGCLSYVIPPGYESPIQATVILLNMASGFGDLKNRRKLRNSFFEKKEWLVYGFFKKKWLRYGYVQKNFR